MKNKIEHTPGPWEINHDKIEGVRPICQIYHPCGDVVDWPTETPDSGDMEAEANARLIAAAPELASNHDYLDDVMPDVSYLDDSEPVEIVITAKAVRDIRAAIAKAKGGA